MTLDYEQEYALKQHEERCRNFTESNKAAIEFSKMALRGAFALNGAAAIAVLYNMQRLSNPECVAALFAGGALCAAVATGATYLCQYCLTHTWRRYVFENLSPSEEEAVFHGRVQNRAANIAHLFRVVAILLILVAYACFGFGAHQGYRHAINPVQTQEPDKARPTTPETPQRQTP